MAAEQCILAAKEHDSICSKSEGNHFKVYLLSPYKSDGSTPINGFFLAHIKPKPNSVFFHISKDKKEEEKNQFLLVFVGQYASKSCFRDTQKVTSTSR